MRLLVSFSHAFSHWLRKLRVLHLAPPSPAIAPLPFSSTTAPNRSTESQKLAAIAQRLRAVS